MLLLVTSEQTNSTASISGVEGKDHEYGKGRVVDIRKLWMEV